MEDSLKTANTSKAAIAGAISGCVTRLLFQPLDVLKTRFQLQVEPIKRDSLSKYRSLPQAFTLIIKEEGLSALWKGHVPAQLLSIVYGTSQFYFYNLIMEHANKHPLANEWRNSLHFSGGAVAGTISTVIAYPFDTLRTRLIAQSTANKIYHGLIHSFLSIIRQESPKALFRGISAAILQIAPNTALQFYFFGIFKEMYGNVVHDSTNSVIGGLVAGSCAGLTAKTIIYPLDLARKRLQIQGFQHGRKGFGIFFQCSGMFHCFVLTLQREGVSGLFKGLFPSQIKAAATTAFHFTVYEQSLVLMEHWKQKNQ